MTLPAWWPDWTGETCVIVASGPSAKGVPLELLKGRARFVAVNRSWELAPWSDLLYGCDFKWWKSVAGCQAFNGIKVSQDARCRDQPEWCVEIVKLFREDRLQLEKGTVGWGNNGGFQAFNLVIQFGAARILLVGFDMNVRHGVHWHGAHRDGMNNPSKDTTRRWIRSMDGAAPTCGRLGVEVVNCSSISALKNYPKQRFEDAVASWV